MEGYTLLRVERSIGVRLKDRSCVRILMISLGGWGIKLSLWSLSFCSPCVSQCRLLSPWGSKWHKYPDHDYGVIFQETIFSCTSSSGFSELLRFNFLIGRRLSVSNFCRNPPPRGKPVSGGMVRFWAFSSFVFSLVSGPVEKYLSLSIHLSSLGGILEWLD